MPANSRYFSAVRPAHVNAPIPRTPPHNFPLRCFGLGSGPPALGLYECLAIANRWSLSERKGTHMATYIPAIRANMGGTDYFVSSVTFGEAARMVDYVEDVDNWTDETPPELKL